MILLEFQDDSHEKFKTLDPHFGSLPRNCLRKSKRLIKCFYFFRISLYRIRSINET